MVDEGELSSAYSPRLPTNGKKGSLKKAMDHENNVHHDTSSSAYYFVDGDLQEKISRRGFMKAGAAAFLPLAMAMATATRANAFQNRKDDKYAAAGSTPGKQPKDLGHSQRSNYVGLKECGTAPNCWNSSAPKANIPARWLPGWDANGGSIDDVKKIIDTYDVGHDDIDGGGFKVIEFNNNKSDNNQYIYVQFQSYKAGYIDDFECWFNPESKKYDVRSSSRVGYSDIGVNAVRLQYIATRLENECGWTFERSYPI